MGNNHDSILSEKIQNLPDKPGVYQFYDHNGNILYIGKAKSLRKRVASYFNKNRYESGKIKVLVRKIRDIQHIIVDSESDAFLLENNLIKKYQPRYNINLKDDKTFPWICVKNERFPRVFSTRNFVKDGSRYYGPYTSAATVRILLTLIRELYKLRTCHLNLSEENIRNKKFKVCLEYHLENCKGPCEELQSEDDYNQAIDQIHNILKGNLKDVIDYLKKLMQQLSREYKFEEAEKVKNNIVSLEKFQLKSTVVNTSIHNVDVFSLIEKEKFAFVNFLKVVNGAIIQAHTLEISKKLDESKEELLEYAINEIRERLFSNSGEMILPFKVDNIPENTKQIVPVRGDKKKLLELSQRNTKYFMLERQKQKANAARLKNQERILNNLKKDLHMNTLPVHIECFDNSNIQGTNPVASCVVFKNGKPRKKEYRHYNIKTVRGADDFASMKEVVYRRYSRLINEQSELPQLIIIDGGKGQLNAAVVSLEILNLRGKISIIGIAKKLEEIYFPDDPVPLYIDKNSESLKLIQFLRNEAHRFGLNFHRTKRSNFMTRSELETIPGIGQKTIELLISNFGSVKNLKKADKSEISKLIGLKKTEILLDYL